MLFFAWPYRLAAITLCIAAVVAISQALAAANTVPATHAGDGAGTVSGYTVSSVVYTLKAPTRRTSTRWTSTSMSRPRPAPR